MRYLMGLGRYRHRSKLYLARLLVYLLGLVRYRTGPVRYLPRHPMAPTDPTTLSLTPSDVLALIARDGLGVAPREAEVG